MSGGPKKYVNETRGGKSVVKVKGLTVNYRAFPATVEKHVKRQRRRNPHTLSPLYSKNPPT
jgi:hypothetical protein